MVWQWACTDSVWLWSYLNSSGLGSWFCLIAKMKHGACFLLAVLCRATLRNSDITLYQLALTHKPGKHRSGAHPLEALIETCHVDVADGAKSASERRNGQMSS
jgi:hypothetical protein